MTVIRKNDYFTQVADGKIAGEEIMIALGERDTFGITANGEDVWRGNELSPLPTSHTTIPTPNSAGEQMSVVSENVNDTLLGAGVQTLLVEYIRAGGIQASEIVDMDGTTPVDLSVSDVIFIQDIHSETVGANGVAAGHIKIHNTANVGLVYNMIQVGGNKSLVPLRMIPAGKHLILKEWYATEAQGKRVMIRIRSTDMHNVLKPNVFCFKGTSYMKSNASPPMAINQKIPSMSIVKVSGWAIQTGAECSCSWWGVLKDN